MGLVQGVVNSFLWLGSFRFIYTDDSQEPICLREWSLGEAYPIDYLSLLGASLVLSLMVMVVIFLVLPAFGKLAPGDIMGGAGDYLWLF